MVLGFGCATLAVTPQPLLQNFDSLEEVIAESVRHRDNGSSVPLEARIPEFVVTYPVGLFLSTGRSGTQWMREELRRLYGAEIHVCHEPIAASYDAKRYLRAHSADFLRVRAPARVLEHVRSIETTVQSKMYIETGWPCFAALPLFVKAFGETLRCIHIHRHPVDYASSLMTHKYYSDDRNDECTQYMQLDPNDPGVLHKEYAAQWDEMDQFERCMFLWLEIHSYIEEMKPILDERLMTCSYEQVFHQGLGLAPITDFLGLERKGAGRITSTVDRWHANLELSQEAQDLLAYIQERVGRHPHVVELAQKFGYDCQNIDVTRILERHRSD